MKITRSIQLTICLITVAFSVFGATKNSVSNGNWHNPSTWMPVGVPDFDDTVKVNHNVIVDKWTNTTIDVLWIASGAVLSGDSSMGLHGSLIVDGTVDLEEFGIGNGAETINNGTMTGGSYATNNIILTNNGTISCDELSSGNEDLINHGLIDVSSFITSDNCENYGAILASDEVITSDNFLNGSGAVIVTETFSTSGGTFTNNGDVTTDNWSHNQGTVTGSGGKFCVASCFLNAATISGTIDICDASPGGFCDIAIGTIASSVTLCTASPCSTDPVVGIEDKMNTASGQLEATIFPNPMREHAMVTVANLNAAVYNLSITNLSGQQVYSKENVTSTQTAIDVPFESGIYICTVQTRSQTRHLKFIVN